MPVRLHRRRDSITGLSPEAELQAWSMFFSTGHDYFHDLKILGIPRTHEGPRARAGEAWERLGGMFMESWRPTASRQTPWACDEFGDPE